MPFNVSSVVPIVAPQIVAPQIDSIVRPASQGSEFHDILSSTINQVESSRNEASQNVQRFISGEGDDLHSTILSVQRADLEFEMTMQLRNKVVSAYQEVMRMQM
jgi:flagellar hook-basal body complex protein FliE